MGPLFLAVAAALWSSRSGYLQKKSSRKLYHGLSCLTGGFFVYLVGTGLPYVTPFSRIRRFCLSVGLLGARENTTAYGDTLHTSLTSFAVSQEEDGNQERRPGEQRSPE